MPTNATKSSKTQPKVSFPPETINRTMSMMMDRNLHPLVPPLQLHQPTRQGTCSFHLMETQDCVDDSKTSYAVVTLLDNNEAIIGQTSVDSSENPIGNPFNVGDSLSFESKLPKPLVVTGAHDNDYVQFTYGDLSWTWRATSRPAACSNGGWDPRNGQICGRGLGIRMLRII